MPARRPLLLREPQIIWNSSVLHALKKAISRFLRDACACARLALHRAGLAVGTWRAHLAFEETFRASDHRNPAAGFAIHFGRPAAGRALASVHRFAILHLDQLAQVILADRKAAPIPPAKVPPVLSILDLPHPLTQLQARLGAIDFAIHALLVRALGDDAAAAALIA